MAVDNNKNTKKSEQPLDKKDQKKNLKKEPKLFHVKVVKSSLGVKAAKMGVLL